ncbi:class I SAM-dependent methyltransferase [Microcoleus sp. FACHB-672]|uniref:class I SAM-dependent methyltransferase n=1 Tax=Microcoleus sp. FACHB-672 TaxID=2692825 RepID=UPI001683BD47|nr:class I SAM-dependent methyltransferase [Microcoleus sp. FACHB-672]MBD2040235.1 class I SAM-dependent methyltransferase [Microcoleus sp. FACHB-672]
MSSNLGYSDYDPLAQMYNNFWGEELAEVALQPIEQLFLQHLPEEAHILDLCCGSGQLAQKLLLKGYKVTGIDGSEKMLHYARENAPAGQFILDDARFFKLPATFHGVVSTTYALQHIMNIEELTKVFQNVYDALLENGWFVFDLSLEERFQSSSWQGLAGGDVQDNYAWAMQRSYQPAEKIGTVKITIFQLIDETWQRTDNTTLMKCYFPDEIQLALKSVGFKKISIYHAEREFAIPISGKIYVVCQK